MRYTFTFELLKQLKDCTSKEDFTKTAKEIAHRMDRKKTSNDRIEEVISAYKEKAKELGSSDEHPFQFLLKKTKTKSVS